MAIINPSQFLLPNQGGVVGSAQENIALQEEQLARTEELTRPFREAGLGTALPSLVSLARGGEVDFQPSQLFRRQLERGREGILRSQAGAGGVKSSRTFERLSDLVAGLAAEDIGRYEQGQLSLLQTGLGAERQLSQASQAMTGNVGAIYGNLGQQQNIAGQIRGQAARARGETRARGIESLAMLPLLAMR